MRSSRKRPHAAMRAGASAALDESLEVVQAVLDLAGGARGGAAVRGPVEVRHGNGQDLAELEQQEEEGQVQGMEEEGVEEGRDKAMYDDDDEAVTEAAPEEGLQAAEGRSDGLGNHHRPPGSARERLLGRDARAEPGAVGAVGQSGPAEHSSRASSEALVATAEGTVVRIFDIETFLFKKKECNHIVTVRPIPDTLELDLNHSVCSDCSTENENWLCLVCHKLFCGRFENRHMLEHFRATGHCVSMSLSDLSVWCYGCDMYLNHDFFPRLHRFFTRMHTLKFSEEPQNAIRARSDTEELHFWDNLGPMGELLCSHMDHISRDFARITDMNQPCATCVQQRSVEGTAQENWLCLTCLGVFCGRYNAKHMLEHFQTTGHAACLSFQDLSIWCYNCVQYVDHNITPASQDVFNHFLRLKFPD